VYGTQGTGSTSNYPGGRQEMAYWADAAGNFWLFGGQSGGSYFNDLWKYNVTSGQWTWVSGSNTANATAVYGTQGTAAAGNVPNARKGTVGWVDSTGKLWLFGGEGSSAGWYSDLWNFQPTIGQWTWVRGPQTSGNNGLYGTKGTPASTNYPGGRKNLSRWVDPGDGLWLFGGDGIDAGGGLGTLGDLWKY